jgi:hypothetical protein
MNPQPPVSFAPLSYVQNDTLPAIRCVYQTTDPTTCVTSPVDITGYTFELVFVKCISNTSTQMTKTAIIDNAPAGQFSFHWGTGDLDTVGIFPARITLITAGGDRQSWQNLQISVTAEVGTG